VPLGRARINHLGKAFPKSESRLLRQFVCGAKLVPGAISTRPSVQESVRRRYFGSQAGLKDLRFHDLRHTGSKRLVAARTMEIGTAQELVH